MKGEMKMNRENLSLKERMNILKMILFFDESGLKLSDIAESMKISRIEVRKDLEKLTDELKKDGINLIYENYVGYKLEGNKGKLLIKRVETLEEIMAQFDGGSFFVSENNDKWESSDYFYGYIKYENIEIVREFLAEIRKKMNIEIREQNYSKVFSYILILINFEKLYNNDRKHTVKKFLLHTPEYLISEEVLKKIFTNRNKDFCLNDGKLLLIADLITGIMINGFSENSFYQWINEGVIIEKIISKAGKLTGIDFTNDIILYKELLNNIKPAIYRIKNEIQIVNSVFKEMILNNDPILEIAEKAVQETEKIFNIKFGEYSLCSIGFHINSAIERSKRENVKKVILICGLGYGSSKILEQSLKENYELDIIDVLPYYLADDLIPGYENIDLIISTISLNRKYHVPVIKINPLLKENDFKKLSEYGMEKSSTKISLRKLLKIIENNTEIKNMQSLVNDLKKGLDRRIRDDLSEIGSVLKGLLNRDNVKFLDNVKSWQEGMLEAGTMLVKNKNTTFDYVNEMIELVEKHGPYIIIDEGIAMPHAGISENVLKTGVSLLIVKEKVKFSDGRGVNIFLSFAAKNKNEHMEILNDLFELTTKYGFIEKISKISKYEELESYFENI
ncbi:PRD domain-containing protein [Leptotrichia sp. OH3620_COT-345]|nr:PRD domain-containing protein [Leptotrichia sp. OH3620_COT-345]